MKGDFHPRSGAIRLDRAAEAGTRRQDSSNLSPEIRSLTMGTGRRAPQLSGPRRLNTYTAQRIAATGPARRHPDNETPWVIVLVAHLERGSAPTPDVLVDRLEGVAPNFPLISSRLHGKWWVPSTLPVISVAESGTAPLAVAPIAAFDLRNEPPVRVVVDMQRDWLVLCAHHFAFDGLGVVSLLRSLLTGSSEVAPDYRVRISPRRAPTDAIRRLIWPADRVAPSDAPPEADSFVSTKVTLPGRNLTARLSRATAAAAGEHNRMRNRPLRRIGLSVAVGGVGGEAATYRRVDVLPGQDVVAAVNEALADPEVPTEVNGLPPGAFLLRPLLKRFSDTALISNLGRLDLNSVTSVEFYPVARGRSAVAIGAAGLAGQPITLTLRARDLDANDAELFLERIVVHLDAQDERS